MIKNKFIKFVSAFIICVIIFSLLSSVSFAAYVEKEDNTEGEKAYPTVDSLSVTSAVQSAIERGLVMKTGSNYMLYKNSRQPIFTADDGTAFGKPIKYEGAVYIPLAAVAGFAGSEITPKGDGISFNISGASGNFSITVLKEDVATGGGVITLSKKPIFAPAEKSDDLYPLIAYDDINKLFPDLCLFYDAMGLIIITDSEVSLDRTNSNDIYYMTTLMQSFVFTFASGEEFYGMVKDNTDNFTHPYLMANQEQFDFIHSVYKDEVKDATYKAWIDTLIKEYEEIFTEYTTLPGNPAITENPDDFDFTKKPDYYEYLAFEITNPLDCGIEKGEWIQNRSFDYGQFPVIVDGKSQQPLGYVGKNWIGGYDYGSSRCDYPANYSEEIRKLALAYQITREEKYATLAYEMTSSLIKWDHWGQSHFLDCATTASCIGVTYDWCYNIWRELGYDTNKVAQAIYEKAVFYGYIVSLDLASQKWCEYFDEDPSVIDRGFQGTVFYLDEKYNWNAVCTSGLVIGMLAIIGAEDTNGIDASDTGTEVDYTLTNGHGIIEGGKDPITFASHTHYEGLNILYWLIEKNTYTLAKHGLIEYAPDGSFVEGPGYWGYATNNLVRMIWAIETAVGDDLGWQDFWGIDQTFYYTVFIEYPTTQSENGYQYWNYHDSWPAYMDTSMFLYAADMLEDEALAALRLQQIENGKPLSLWDLLGYKKEYLTLNAEDITLQKDYIMLAMNGVTTRSSWENGCIFTGLIGNMNGDTPHGQIDAGAFTYASSGYAWFVDTGADNYDAYGYFVSSVNQQINKRHNYYRNNAEGANTVCITSQPDEVPYGQAYAGGGYLMLDYHQSSENGSVTLLNNSNVFSSSTYGSYTSSFYRGLMLTNNRRTTVIQDQIVFKQAQSIAWVAHTEVARSNIIISDDGRTAYLLQNIDGTLHCLRVALLSDDLSLKFEVMRAGVSETKGENGEIISSDFLLEKTYRPGYSESMGGAKEYSRSTYSRLVIKAEGILKFNCAVVIEEVGSVNTAQAVGYTWTDLFSWNSDRIYKTDFSD